MQAVIQSNPRMAISGKTLLLTVNAIARVNGEADPCIPN